MVKEIVKFDKFPFDTWDIYQISPEKHKAILNGASIEVPWGDKKIILRKLKGGLVDSKLTNKSNAIKNKIKISEEPVAYQIQKFNFRIIPLYEIK